MKRAYTVAVTVALAAATTLGTVPVFGQALQAPERKQAADIDSLERDIANRVNEAVTAGRLSPEEAADFHQQLHFVAESEASYRAADGDLNSWETLKLALDLDHVARMLEYRLRDRRIAFRDVTPRKVEMERRLSQALAANRLSAEQAANIRKELRNIWELERLLSRDGKVDAVDALALWLDLDRVAAQMEHELSERT